MKKIILFLLVFFIFHDNAWANVFTKITLDDVTLHYVSYDITSPIYKLKVSISEDNATKTLWELMEQENAVTGINGVFFCPADYSECQGKNYTINERFVKGEDLSFYEDTGDRAVFWWDTSMNPFIFQTEKINPEKRQDIFEWMWNFPLLLNNGVSMLEYYHDVALYDNKMRLPKTRHFICSTQDKQTIIFGKSSAASLDNLTPILAQIGCWDALNLDAGGSSQFIYNGRKLDYATRNILDSFVIEYVDIQVAELNKKIDDIMEILTPEFHRISQKHALKHINELLKQIPKIRHTIYLQHSFDVLDDDGKVIGYEAEIQDKKVLTQVYLLNRLEIALKHLRWDIKNKD